MTTLLALLTVHFVADFMLQSDWMAINKSKRWDVLALHCGIYSLGFLWWGWRFALLTFVLHFVTDACTSRLTSFLYPRSRHWFFVAIGFDQLLHAYALAGAYLYLFPVR